MVTVLYCSCEINNNAATHALQEVITEWNVFEGKMHKEYDSLCVDISTLYIRNSILLEKKSIFSIIPVF